MSISTSTSNLPSLISSNSNLESALSHVEQASNLFNSPDSASRTQGENTFLELRASENALDLAAFFLREYDSPEIRWEKTDRLMRCRVAVKRYYRTERKSGCGSMRSGRAARRDE